MASPLGSRAGKRDLNPTIAGIGLGALAVVVLVLVFISLTENRPVANAGSTPTAAAAATAPAEPPPIPTGPTSLVPPAAPLPVPDRVIAAIDSDSAVRIARTSCPTPATVEVTDDAGATWIGNASNVADVQRIMAGSDAHIALVGLDVEGCAPTYERSFVTGAAWEAAPDELGATWFVNPANHAGIHSPAGDRPAPCGVVVQLAAIDANSAAVLCGDGAVHATIDSGETWLSPASVPGAAAIGSSDGRYVLAVLNQNGCPGAQVVELTMTEAGLAPGIPGACLSAAVGSGEAAIAANGDAIWIWAGEALGRSADGGTSWL